MTKENEIKKEYLCQHARKKRAVERIEAQINELRLDKMCPSIAYNDMPHSTDIKDMSDYMSSLDALITKLVKSKYERIKFYTEIEQQIELMPSETLQEVIVRKYIKGQTFEDIASSMTYSFRQILRLHGDALNEFKLPENKHVM